MARLKSSGSRPDSGSSGGETDMAVAQIGDTGQTEPQIHESDKCPECGGRLHSGKSETVCHECGLVVEDTPIDHGPEWRNREDSNNGVRCNGAPETILIHDKGLGTQIDSTVGSGRIHRQSMYHRRSRADSGEGRVRYVLSQIQRIGSRLSLPTYVMKDAAYYARRAHEQDVPNGRSLEWVTGGVIYAAIRERELPVRPNEVSEYLREDDATVSGREGILQAYSHICRALDLSITPMLPKDHAPRLFDALTLRTETEIEVRRLLGEVEGETGGATPSAVAAGAVRLVSKKKPDSPTLKEIASVYGHSQNTVRNNERRIESVVSGETPP